MTIYYESGSETTDLSADDIRQALASTLSSLGQPQKILAIPPDYTRFDSRAGEITCLLHELVGDRLTDVMPALGTHLPMEPKQIAKMFGSLPAELIRPHRWRDDVVTLGQVDSDFVHAATDGIYHQPWPAQVNKMLTNGGHDLILSIGQVVPHEVIGMANYNKNVFVGTGGPSGINESHYLSALYGMERIMGRCATPLRKVLNQASDLFCQNMPIVYVLTVVESHSNGRKITRGLYIGDEHEAFWRAGRLAAKVNCFRIEQPPSTMVVYMHPEKYKRVWVANKAIYRTRMAIGDQGKLVILAPGVDVFGEDVEIDRLIRKYGYRTTPEILEMVKQNAELRNNLSAAAHLIHGSSENRFQIVYGAGHLSAEEVRSVGYEYAQPQSIVDEYRINESMSDGWHQSASGESFYFIKDPGLGLWMHNEHQHAFEPDQA